MKWKSNLTDRNIRQLKQKGGKVVIVPEKYSSIDLEDARKQCGIRQPQWIPSRIESIGERASNENHPYVEGGCVVSAPVS
jgi:hypothetical protein